MREDEMREPDVVFNMDLANAPTSARFCYEAAAVLDEKIPREDEDILDAYGSDYGHDDADYYEQVSDIVREWTDKLESASYAVRWDAGDVVVWDLRGWTDEEREEFWTEVEG